MADADCTRTHTCGHCGTNFSGRKRRYCSNQCAHDHREAYAANARRNLKVAKCHGCGEQFEYRAKPGQPPRYCDPQCKPSAPIGELVKTCPSCGEEFIGRAKKKYCSSECRSKEKHHRTYDRLKAEGRTRREVGKANCQNCGKEFTVYHNTHGKYCSRQCGLAHAAHSKESTEKRRRTRLDKTLEANQGKFSPAMDGKCLHCEAAYTKSRRPGLFCSVECRKASAEQNKKWNLRMVHGHLLTQIKICPETGWLFRPDHNSQIYATREIAHRVGKRIAKAKRRARKKNNGRMESIDPVEVFRSVDYVCQICGCQTEADMRGTYDPKAPELDHIIPLSVGGTHTWGNVQCACRECNRSKSDSLPKKHNDRQARLEL